MPEQKISFWKKYEFVIIAAITLAFIYALVFFNQKINFLLGNELIVYLTPQQKSLSMNYGNITEINFYVSIDNAAYCKAFCAYSFNDRSRNELIDKGNFEIGKSQHQEKNYNLSVKRLGSGQDIYSFEVSCRSIKTYLCLTKGAEKSRSSLAVVNYDLTETEKKLKEILKKNVTSLLEELKNTDLIHQKANQKLFELGIRANLQSLSKQKISIDDDFDKTRIEIENFRSLWSIEDYQKLNELFNETLFVKLKDIKQSLESLNISINSIVALHNTLIFKLWNMFDLSSELNSFVSIIGDSKLQGNFDFNLGDLHRIAASLTNNTFEYYDNISKEINKANVQQNSLIDSAKAPALRVFFELNYILNFEKDFSCSLKQECESNNSVSNLIKNAEFFSQEFPNSSRLLHTCDLLSDLYSEYARARDDASLFIEDKNISYPASGEFNMIASSFKENKFRQINNSYYGSFSQIRQENKTSRDIIEYSELFLPKNITSMAQDNYNESVNLSLYTLSRLNFSESATEFLNKCSMIGTKLAIPDINLQQINTDINYTPISGIETNLSDNPPICCVFNECKPCCMSDLCRNDPATFPIIFLHGHSFAKSNSPEFSLDSFNKLQTKLQEDGYLNAGIVSFYSKNEPLQNGIWGMSGKPVTVKVSYYYDAFKEEDKYIVIPTKSENIDTYALRLKELIGIVKQRTNTPKVSIIAHSMGGLVARRYLQIFGEDDIDKMIMIAAPNKGITNSVSNYCGIIGENRECRDMQQNSLFLNKLNEKSAQPQKVKLYAIIGQGCNTDGKDGDGVVLAENAKLENSNLYFVNGTCGGLFSKILHTEILNVDEYPETYRILTEILKE